jgi:hypothetical protein
VLDFVLDSSKDDLQPTAVESPEMSISLLHRSRSRASTFGIARTCHKLHARSCKQRQRFGSLSSVWKCKQGNLFVEKSVLTQYLVNIQVFQWKLFNHVSGDHNMTLKHAHLSCKCTVCTATFGMYKLFENHVYSAQRTKVQRPQLDRQAETIRC